MFYRSQVGYSFWRKGKIIKNLKLPWRQITDNLRNKMYKELSLLNCGVSGWWKPVWKFYQISIWKFAVCGRNSRKLKYNWQLILWQPILSQQDMKLLVKHFLLCYIPTKIIFQYSKDVLWTSAVHALSDKGEITFTLTGPFSSFTLIEWNQ